MATVAPPPPPPPPPPPSRPADADKAAAFAEMETRVDLLRLSPFLTKLYKIVCNPATDEFIHWNESGTALIIERPKVFARDLLPKHFETKQLSSHVRQLNMYGFHKVPQTTTQASAVANSDGERLEFINEHFRRDQPELLVHIQRKRTRGDDSANERSLSLFNEYANANFLNNANAMAAAAAAAVYNPAAAGPNGLPDFAMLAAAAANGGNSGDGNRLGNSNALSYDPSQLMHPSLMSAASGNAAAAAQVAQNAAYFQKLAQTPVANLVQEIDTLKRQQDSLVNEMRAVRRENMSLSLAVRNCYDQQQDTITKILGFLASVFLNGRDVPGLSNAATSNAALRQGLMELARTNGLGQPGMGLGSSTNAVGRFNYTAASQPGIDGSRGPSDNDTHDPSGNHVGPEYDFAVYNGGSGSGISSAAGGAGLPNKKRRLYLTNTPGATISEVTTPDAVANDAFHAPASSLGSQSSQRHPIVELMSNCSSPSNPLGPAVAAAGITGVSAATSAAPASSDAAALRGATVSTPANAAVTPVSLPFDPLAKPDALAPAVHSPGADILSYFDLTAASGAAPFGNPANSSTGSAVPPVTTAPSHLTSSLPAATSSPSSASVSPDLAAARLAGASPVTPLYPASSTASAAAAGRSLLTPFAEPGGHSVSESTGTVPSSAAAFLNTMNPATLAAALQALQANHGVTNGTASQKTAELSQKVDVLQDYLASLARPTVSSRAAAAPMAPAGVSLPPPAAPPAAVVPPPPPYDPGMLAAAMAATLGGGGGGGGANPDALPTASANTPIFPTLAQQNMIAELLRQQQQHNAPVMTSSASSSPGRSAASSSLSSFLTRSVSATAAAADPAMGAPGAADAAATAPSSVAGADLSAHVSPVAAGIVPSPSVLADLDLDLELNTALGADPRAGGEAAADASPLLSKGPPTPSMLNKAGFLPQRVTAAAAAAAAAAALAERTANAVLLPSLPVSGAATPAPLAYPHVPVSLPAGTPVSGPGPTRGSDPESVTANSVLLSPLAGPFP
ncbi:hypothetical protein CXG81DRAFT_24190 [Caulochytrium protostelioides]|uniref:HSF-type DNA-binding domain-containing protein n=1 Tax=Caulochytrium protostelioides TaxID=1555241 RepID=A0A4V1IV86_9FUNG|nr:hypothetical protein CXG81DRAFT_24190 [Caulochytrium protostelioides]|eukprot:RKP03189.1 hypothetical protein CXG81DRAFT_24190 [Caulochytrium protostelioides]